MSDTVRTEIRVTGVVQGVGFRPFVYRTAVARDLAGWARNLGDAGVNIVLEGEPESIDVFLEELRTDPPPLSRIESVDVKREAPTGLADFEIMQSDDAAGGSGTIPPDTGMCDNCRADMRNPDSRYHGYWATACVDCGPRFTVIRELPYDRPRTSMDAFPMCEDCRTEYEAPSDRRYHAQAIACPDCGPELSLIDPSGTRLATRDDAIRQTGARLADGGVVAVKGVGGTHLVCDATEPAVVAALRERTGRPRKPFAVMSPSLSSIESFAQVSDRERATLTDVRRPILLLEYDGGPDWLDVVAPGLHTVGAMLPYSGLHHRLFDHVDGPLVLTSGNLPGHPMCTSESAILDRLGTVVDAALVHDRPIVARCDDTVARISAGRRQFLRRSRGWVPEALPRPGAEGVPDVLAVGPESDVTTALARGDEVLLSQYVGDVDDPETLAFHRDAREHLADITGAQPAVVACDLHPEFETTAEAEQLANDGLDGPVRVQHHHAHAAGLLAEHDHDRAIVITADGTGYGPDGAVWGGEILDATTGDYTRVGGLDTFELPGGQAAIERPARILASLLADTDRIDDLLETRDAVHDAEAAALVRQQLDQQINTPLSTSAGRYLDAISALLDICTVRHYEGEPAMKLEAAATAGDPIDYDIPFTTREETQVVDVATLVQALDDLQEQHSIADIAATAQQALADGLGTLAVRAARTRRVDTVGFSGGVAYNESIARRLRTVVEAADLRFLQHDQVPPGDGGISYGQAVIATARYDSST